ncbi:MAG: UvrD-helicase domain-containing protein [Opitutaceae bacterium]|jgi:ATP-dependent helicase/nuclease subunit A
MKKLGHKMILASAGSGKTYALTNRFVQLLACGAPPERIVALTFTRKAAGEFFDEILNKLARAALDPKEAQRIGANIGEPQLMAADFLRMLRAMVTAMHRLSLGTLDSFFAKVVRAFPLELGLGGDFEILQEHGVQLERQRVLRQLFARAGGELDEAQVDFIEAFKRATFGAEEKRLASRLDRFIDEHQNVFLDAPDADAWGNPQRIWPEGSAWLGKPGDTNGADEVIRRWAAGACANEKQQKRWDDFLEAMDVWAPGAAMAKSMDYVMVKALEVWAVLGEEDVELIIERKKQTVPPEIGAVLKVLVSEVFRGELTRRLEMTQGIHTVLSGYEAIYHDLVRRAGKLTFADVQRLLMPEAGAPALSAGGEGEDGRLFVDWRLDAKYDHWLLDEFQDTSHGQWSVLRNLIDEAVQDPEGRRSLFYVGDVKQAIYAWRGGDPRLFREIFDHYNEVAPGTIEEGRLDKSWRSGPVIVETVNRVFGDAAVLARMLPTVAAERWTREWRDHESAKPQLGGQVVWLHGADEHERAALTLKLLSEINPLERGLSVAVLVQSNDKATWLADYLRREGGLPAVAASDLHVCMDNPLTTAVLALLQAAAHPGDRFAWEQVRMTPLASLVESGEGLTREVLRQVHEEGFARTVETWLRRLEPLVGADDSFSRERARQLTEAAQRFDETGGRDVAEFVQFAERHVVRDAETATVVRVMTIHKSKGLGFDVVVLPDLEGNALATPRRDGLAVQRAEDREVEWVLDMPPKLFHEHDEVLAAHMAGAEADAAYEKLCLFYVATTRAKRAMYLITKPLSEKSTSANFPRLLTETLGAAGPTETARVGAWACDAVFAEGDGKWFEAISVVGESNTEMQCDRGILVLPEIDPVARHPARTPSGTKTGMVTGAVLFGATSASAANFGTAVHQAFSAVEWGGMTPELLALWNAAGLGDPVVAEARACLDSEGLGSVFGHERGFEVWRERMFEIVLDGAWITGVFDRVVLKRDSQGRVVAVTVYDFKTDRLVAGGEAVVLARYAGQMDVYRRAAARLAGLSEAFVRCVLVLTSLRSTVEVMGAGAD